KDAEHFIPTNGGAIAPGLLRVLSDEFVARVPSVSLIEGVADSFAGGGAAHRPVTESQPNIGERIADSRHFPIEYSFDAIEGGCIEHDVVELEVIVNEGGLAGRGNGSG